MTERDGIEKVNWQSVTGTAVFQNSTLPDSYSGWITSSHKEREGKRLSLNESERGKRVPALCDPERERERTTEVRDLNPTLPWCMYSLTAPRFHQAAVKTTHLPPPYFALLVTPFTHLKHQKPTLESPCTAPLRGGLIILFTGSGREISRDSVIMKGAIVTPLLVLGLANTHKAKTSLHFFSCTAGQSTAWVKCLNKAY